VTAGSASPRAASAATVERAATPVRSALVVMAATAGPARPRARPAPAVPVGSCSAWTG
jgi:hypothetical protein